MIIVRLKILSISIQIYIFLETQVKPSLTNDNPEVHKRDNITTF